MTWDEARWALQLEAEERVGRVMREQAEAAKAAISGTIADAKRLTGGG